MDKRYQVFVSSTYTDLKDAHRRVIETLLESDCIPIGMELFPAADAKAWEYIKGVIDECDYYIVIVGGRYGSVDPDGISFTEKEYVYAKQKEVYTLAFLHGEPNKLPLEASEIEPKTRESLASFRSKVEGHGLVKYWTSIEELAGKIAVSINHAKKRAPQIGWVRSNSVPSVEVYQELEGLRKHCAELEAKASAPAASVVDPSIASGEDEVTIPIRLATDRDESDNTKWRYESDAVTITWNQLFTDLAPRMLSPRSLYHFRYDIESAVLGHLSEAQKSRLFRQDKVMGPAEVIFKPNQFEPLSIALHFAAMGLAQRTPEPQKVDVHVTPPGDTYFMLTPAGEAKLTSMRAFRKQPASGNDPTPS